MPEELDEKRAHPETLRVTEAGAMISLGVFVKQEMERFNKLLRLVRSRLRELIQAIDGTVVMSQLLEDQFNSFINGKVPLPWLDTSVGYPSLKPLVSWVNDLVARIRFVGQWLYDGPPKSYWLSSFYFPQGFMTATMQTYARET